MPDGIKRSRLHARRDTPFGQEFKYTDPFDLTGEFTLDGKSPTSLWERIKAKFKGKPLAWVVAEPEDNTTAAAYICPPHAPVISPVEPSFMVPVYDENVILAMDHYEKEQESSPHDAPKA